MILSNSLSIPITPLGKPRQTQRDKWQQRPAVIRYRNYCDELRYYLGPDYELPETLCITFFLPMPPSWSFKVRTNALGKPHDQKPDLDNLCKGFIDAFKVEDKRVYAIRAEKYWSEDGEISLEPYVFQPAATAASS